MDNITNGVGKQEEIAGERLKDNRYPWRERKMKTLKLAELYELAGWPDYAERAKTCATWLQYLAQEDGSKQLHAANFCQLRLCPMCIARRAKRAAYKLSQVLDKVEADHEGTMYLFLTLTVKNCYGEDLGPTVGEITRAWERLMDQRPIERAVKGWFRAVEVTRKGADSYHPHLHAILAVEPAYFSRKAGLYITQGEWIDRWQKALRSDYKPSVRVQTTKAKGQVTGGRAAAVEAAKYATKDSDYIDPKLPKELAADIVVTYTIGLRRRRLTAYGGWLKEAARALDAEDLETGDLVHTEDETIRADVAELIEEYNWHFGAGDYILSNRRLNPLRVVRDAQQ